MNKYDYGYELLPGTTSEWAFNKIKENSEVLELGPAIGNLAKHLKEEKRCFVDIIELDEEAGKMAMRFARRGLIGAEQGNLEADYWYNELKTQRYDYVVILDVLEHLLNAEKLLKRVSKLLKDDGKLIISLPNIAHNSVILNLLRNQFVYTKDGLLDDTHVKFYTYYSFCEMLSRCDLKAIHKEALQIAVGMNEIGVQYEAVPKSVETFLRTRPLADVYQFLFVVQRQDVSQEEDEFKVSLLNTTKYKFQVYVEGKEQPIEEKFIDPRHIDYTIKLADKTKLLRIDPIEYKCVIKIEQIEGEKKGERIPLVVKYTNGYSLSKNVYAFFADDPNVYIELPEGIEKIHFVCECMEIASDNLSSYQLIRETEEEMEKNNAILKDQKNILEKRNSELEDQKIKLENQRISLEERVALLEKSEIELQSRKSALENELGYYKNLWFNRVFIFVKVLLEKVKDKIK